MSGTVGLDGRAHRHCMLVVDLEPCVTEFCGKRFDGPRVERDSGRVPGARSNFVFGRDEQDAMGCGVCSRHRTNCAVELVAKDPDCFTWWHRADATRRQCRIR